MKIPTPVAKHVAKAAFKTRQHSPTLLLVAGVAGVVTSTVMACKATLKLEKTVDELHHAKMIYETAEINDEFSESDRSKLLVLNRSRTIMAVTKLYAPSVALGIVSIGCFVGSNKVLSSRNAGLMAAYAGLEKTYEAYRARVVEEIGADKEKEIHYGREVETVTGDDGKLKTQLKAGSSQYSFFFDEFSTSFQDTPEYNAMFLRSQQNYANDLLRSRGYVFLNDIHDMLGVPRTPAGQVVGWMYNSDNGDNYIDFGVFEGNTFEAMRFVNGDERSIHLDPNVDGVIWDKI